MRRIVTIASIVLLGVTSFGRAGDSSCWCKQHCMVPPQPPCPDCSCECDNRLWTFTLFPVEHAQKLVAELSCDDPCKRVAAVKKLGCRLHADYCTEPFVLDALLRALQCDSCWGVRRSAAWSLMLQNARTEPTVLALYIASRLDPHYMVRTRAAEALSILTLGKEQCYTELYKAADALILALRVKGYKPGTDCAHITLNPFGAGIILTTPYGPVPEKLPPPSGSAPEKLPPPSGTPQGQPAKPDAAVSHAPVLESPRQHLSVNRETLPAER